MDMKCRSLWAPLLLLAMFFFGSVRVAWATENMATVSLPKGVSIQMQEKWVVLSGGQRIKLDEFVKSGLNLSGIRHARSKLPFAANYLNDRSRTVGILNVRYYPQLDLSQQDARSATNHDVLALDAALKENIAKEMKAFGMSVTSWTGTKKKEINGITVFVTEYSRASANGPGNFRVRLIRVFAGDGSFTLTVSYLDRAAKLMRPMTNRIVDSLEVSDISVSENLEDKSRSTGASGLWSSESGRYAAMFPSPPKRVGAATGVVEGYSYQSAKRFNNGGALYAITIIPLPEGINDANSKMFVEKSNDAFVQAMGQNPGDAKASWRGFGDSRERLDYDFRFLFSGVPFKGRGFWLVDRENYIRVSVSFSESLSSKNKDRVLSFLDSFVLVTKPD
ncbi:hypothetical protein [Guyparkeria sp. TX1]|uniref:hypothetical protein n=1 Tax=Guyparkeria sp. TX1 TaxID=3115001 RepID=UPI00397795FF